jgi:endoglucanase
MHGNSSPRRWAMAATAAVVSCLPVSGFSQPSEPVGYVRFNQLGYEAGQPSRAYLVTAASDAGATLEARDSAGQAVFTTRLGPPAGRWGAFQVTPLDFVAPRAGLYSLAISGDVSLTSTSFSVGRPTALYALAVANALRFYETQRDGADFIASALRSGPAHLNDASARVYLTPPLNSADLVLGELAPTGETVDVSGGWWDAGDYMKYVETASYSVATMLTGLRDFPDQMGPNGPSDFSREGRFGASWLLKMWRDDSRTLYYQVGNSQDFVGRPTLSDYDLWRLPGGDDRLGGGSPDYVYINHRPVFRVGPAGSAISPNLAGRLTAAFSLCFIVYRQTDPTLARQCLVAAEHVFELADATPGLLLTIMPYDGYPETEWRDDMEWGATELSIALFIAGASAPAGLPHPDGQYYLAQAARWAHAYITGPGDGTDTLNLYDVSGLAHFDLYRAIDMAGRPAGLAVSQAELKADLGRQLATALSHGAADPFGYGADWAASDSAAYGIGLSVMADEYRSLGGGPTWRDLSNRWMGNVLGANIWGLSMIVGDGPAFPSCLHHQVANLSGSLTGGGIVLTGAVVEGPSAADVAALGRVDGMRACPANGADRYKVFTGAGSRFRDDSRNYVNTEPAIDLSALSPLMFAWKMAVRPRALGAH